MEFTTTEPLKAEMDWLNCQKWAIQIGLNGRKYEF